MEHKISELSEKTFDDFVKKGVSVVDFWASWCGPCKMMAPIFDEAAHELKGKVKFAKVNVDDESDLAQRFEVMSIPTLIIMKDGEQVDRAIGLMDKEELISRIEEATD